MPYTDRFKLADDLIVHLGPIVATITDPFLVSRYTGFVSIAGVTVYELAIKDIFFDFGGAKHKVLETFTRSYFERLNGRITYRSLHEEHVTRFGDRYVIKFKKGVEACEKTFLRSDRKSVLTSYANLIAWRHLFAHEGQLPANATFGEAVTAYEYGKQVIACLAAAMRR
jgi:hypothetical protein